MSARRRKGPTIAGGILLVDKEAGITSTGVVNVVKRLFGGAKVGHLGTLDPFATGLLPLCVGEATKCAPYLNEADKSYSGTLRLGVSTDTNDPTGEIVQRRDVPAVAAAALVDLEARFTGEIEQVPPVYSAIKRDGEPMYKRARRGEEVELEPRRVRVDRVAFRLVQPDLVSIEVDCSKGTYVRSIARDVGEALGCGAILESLARTRFGTFDLEGAVPLAELKGEDGAAAAARGLIPAIEALAHLRLVEIDLAVASALRSGQQRALTRLGPAENQGERIRVAADGHLVAVAHSSGPLWQLDRVFARL